MRWVYVAGVLAIVGTFIADIWIYVNYDADANVSLIYLAILTSVFALLYGLRSQWYRNRVGRVFLVKSVLLALFVVQATVSSWWGDEYPYRAHIRFIIYTAAAWSYCPMIVSLWQEQQRDRRRRGQVDADPIDVP